MITKRTPADYAEALVPLRAPGSCLECHDGTPADPATYISPAPGHGLAAWPAPTTT
ncbi:hypothetical protein [Streptomyces mirabilis]